MKTIRIRQPHIYPCPASVDGANDLPLTEFGPDEMRYYLQIEAEPGTDLSQPYPLALKVVGQSTGGTIYLPMVNQRHQLHHIFAAQRYQ